MYGGRTVAGEMGVVRPRPEERNHLMRFLSFLDFLGSTEGQIPAESICGHWPSVFGLATLESRWMVPSLAVSRQRGPLEQAQSLDSSEQESQLHA